MKNLIYSAIVLVLVSFHPSVQAGKNNKAAEVLERQKRYVKVRAEDFYRDYITISEDKDIKTVKVNQKKIIKEYLTPEFAASLENAAQIADADPVIQQKDFGKDYATKVAITDLEVMDSDHASATVTLGKKPQSETNPGPAILKLKFLKIKDKWKINSIAKPVAEVIPTVTPAPVK